MRRTRFGCGFGALYFAAAVEVERQVPQLQGSQLHTLQLHGSHSHGSHSHFAQSHLTHSQASPQEQAGPHEQDAAGLTSANLVSVFIEYLLLGLPR